MSFVRLSAAALAMLSMAACAGTPETGQGPKENTGTLVGAVAGARRRKVGRRRGVEESGFRSLWIGGSGSCLSVQRAAVPTLHSHHLYRRPAAGRPRQCVSQSGRNLDRGGVTAAPCPPKPA